MNKRFTRLFSSSILKLAFVPSEPTFDYFSIMKHLFPIFILIGAIYGCCPDKNKGLFYVMPMANWEDSLEEPNFYGHHNFILYNDTTVYYHKIPEQIGQRCGTGLDHTKPPYLDLKPQTLTKLSIKEIPEFWKRNLTQNTKNRRAIISVSSPNDTIFNKALPIIQKLFRGEKDDHLFFSIQRSTEEELLVSKAKFKHKEYDSHGVNWKIGFDHGDTPIEYRTLQFIPPIKEQ